MLSSLKTELTTSIKRNEFRKSLIHLVRMSSVKNILVPIKQKNM